MSGDAPAPSQAYPVGIVLPAGVGTPVTASTDGSVTVVPDASHVPTSLHIPLVPPLVSHPPPVSPDGSVLDHQLHNFFSGIRRDMQHHAPCEVHRFDGKDFTRWQRRMSFYLRETNLWDVIEQPLPVPALRSPEWCRLNNRALSIIFGRCHDEQQELIDDCTTAKEAWDALTQLFSNPSTNMLNKLLDDLNDIRKGSGEDITHYIARGKSMARTIRAAGEPCTDRHLINRLMSGLPSSFDAARDAHSNGRDLDLEGVTKLLLEAETRLASRTRRRSVSPHRVVDDYRSRDIPDRSNVSPRRSVDASADNKSRDVPDRSAHPSYSQRWCTHCGRPGHLIDDCWMLYPERRRYFTPRGQPPLPNTPASRSSQVAAVAQTSDGTFVTLVLSASTTVNPDTLWHYWDQSMMAVELREGDFIPLTLPGQWLIDSGCSNHYTSSRHILSEFRPLSPPIRILTGNGHVTAQGIGSVTLHTSLGTRKLTDVMWVPDLSGLNNLLSVPQLVRKGCEVHMSGTTCTIRTTQLPSKETFLTGTFHGKGYFVDMITCPSSTVVARLMVVSTGTPSTSIVPLPFSSEPTAMMGGSVDTQPLPIWHMRLGHLNERAIRHLVTRSTGMQIGTATPQTLNLRCEPCLRGAQHRQVSYARGNPARRLLEHVWADVKGPLLDKDVHGFRYFVIFVDEKSRYTAVFPLLQKSDVFDAYKLYEVRVERVTNLKIVNLHVDVGGEWVNNLMHVHCRNRGIELYLTAGYAPSMNSIAERAIRTIIEHASALLWASHLPVGFWVCAVRTSVYLLNRSPHSALESEMTPFQAWYNRVPNLGHLRVFGCRAALHVPDELRKKMEWTSKSFPDCIFVGYSDTENLFDLWDVRQKTLLRGRDVVFWEHEMGHPILWMEPCHLGCLFMLGLPVPWYKLYRLLVMYYLLLWIYHVPWTLFQKVKLSLLYLRNRWVTLVLSGYIPLLKIWLLRIVLLGNVNRCPHCLKLPMLRWLLSLLIQLPCRVVNPWSRSRVNILLLILGIVLSPCCLMMLIPQFL